MKRAKRILKLSITISLFDFFALYINIIFKVIFNKEYSLVNKSGLNSIISFNIISNYVLSILILYSAFYRHHFVSMAINLLFLIILVILDILNIINGKLSYPYILMGITKIVLY